jgi:hypothetical protein
MPPVLIAVCSAMNPYIHLQTDIDHHISAPRQIR